MTSILPVPDTLRGYVEVKHVDFSYPSCLEIIAIQVLIVHACSGKTLTLVGPGGCGKSSVATIVQSFYEPTTGVLIDGKDIHKHNPKSLQRHIAIVPQEPCLFASTMPDNIAYGRESATEAEVIEAATLASDHKFTSGLQGGCKTWVGEKRVQLSVGKRQRIAIARDFVKKAEIMLLEATSALDVESERSVQEALERAHLCST